MKHWFKHGAWVSGKVDTRIIDQVPAAIWRLMMYRIVAGTGLPGDHIVYESRLNGK
ncbi:MAG: hypothetical protein P8Z75_06500 [Gammaproteobacteria bacterium]|jgi:hypothetical protein